MFAVCVQECVPENDQVSNVCIFFWSIRFDNMISYCYIWTIWNILIQECIPVGCVPPRLGRRCLPNGGCFFRGWGVCSEGGVLHVDECAQQAFAQGCVYLGVVRPGGVCLGVST